MSLMAQKCKTQHTQPKHNIQCTKRNTHPTKTQYTIHTTKNTTHTQPKHNIYLTKHNTHNQNTLHQTNMLISN